MSYDGISDKYQMYHRFLVEEELAGRIHHTKRATSDWKDSPIVYQVLRQLPPEGIFLDFAAGSGYMSMLGCELGFTPLAVESSAEFRDFLRQNIPGVAVYSDIREVREGEEKAEIALAMHAIEHLEHPVDTLAELRAVLKPGGLLIVVVPNLERSYYRFGEEGTEMEDQIASDGMAFDFPPNHLTRFTGASMKLALERAGFANVAVSFSLVGLWDLFYDGLGDKEFRFTSYFEDKSLMPTIASIERNLNEVLTRLGMENLGNSVIALASDGEPGEGLANRLAASRKTVVEICRQSVEEERELTRTRRLAEVEAREQGRLAVMAEKDEHIASLLATVERKDDELRALEEYLRAASEKKDGYIESLGDAVEKKNAEIRTAQEYLEHTSRAMNEKDALLSRLREELAEKESQIRTLESVVGPSRHPGGPRFARTLARIRRALKGGRNVEK